MNDQEKRETIEALDRWVGSAPWIEPDDAIFWFLVGINDANEMGYTHDEMRKDTKRILAWIRDPTIIDEDHDDSEQWIRKHHG